MRRSPASSEPPAGRGEAVLSASPAGRRVRRNAALFVLISVLSGFGGTAMTLAAGIWILDLTGNAGLAALAALGIYAPSLAGPWLGALVDRFPRRALLIIAELALGLALLSLLTVDAREDVRLIYVVLLVRGVGYVLVDAGETALLPAALPARLLGDVNGWRSSAQEGMKLLAPLAGAGLYAWSGPVPVVLLCAALPLVSGALYALLRLADDGGDADADGDDGGGGGGGDGDGGGGNGGAAGRLGDGAGRGGGDAGPGGAAGGNEPVTPGPAGVRAGLVVLAREPLRTPVLLATVAIAVSGLTSAAVMSRLVDGLNLPATHLGFLSSAQGAGSMAAGLLVGRLLARMPAARVAGLGAMVFAAACVAWSLPWWPLMIAGSVLAGAGLPWALVAAVTAIQAGAPEHLLGRVAATGNTAMFGPLALTIPLGAALVALGGRVPLLAGALLVLLAVAASRGHLSGRSPHAPSGARIRE